MISLIASFALVAQQVLTPPSPPPPDKTVLTINGHTIPAKTVAGYLWDWGASQIGQVLIRFEVIRQEADKKGIKLTDAEVGQEINSQLQQFQASLPKGTNIEDVLKQRGVPRSRLSLEIRTKMMLERLAGLEFKPEDFVRVATILIRPKSESAADVQTALTAINTAYDSLQKGDQWDQVLSRTATDPSTANNHGELGWLSLDRLPATAQTEMATLKLMGYAKPVQTPNGWQIFRLETRGKDATAAEKTDLKSRFLPTMESKLLSSLQKAAKIETAY